MAVGSLVSLAGPAQAFDNESCRGVFGSDLVDVDPFRLDYEYVDFGDLPHSGPNGAPQADAVVCWSPEKFAILGRLFYDAPPRDYGIAYVRFWSSNAGRYVYMKIDPVPGKLTYRTLVYVSPPGAQTEVEFWMKWRTPDGEMSSYEVESWRGGA